MSSSARKLDDFPEADELISAIQESVGMLPPSNVSLAYGGVAASKQLRTDDIMSDSMAHTISLLESLRPCSSLEAALAAVLVTCNLAGVQRIPFIFELSRAGLLIKHFGIILWCSNGFKVCCQSPFEDASAFTRHCLETTSDTLHQATQALCKQLVKDNVVPQGFYLGVPIIHSITRDTPIRWMYHGIEDVSKLDSDEERLRLDRFHEFCADVTGTWRHLETPDVTDSRRVRWINDLLKGPKSRKPGRVR